MKSKYVQRRRGAVAAAAALAVVFTATAASAQQKVYNWGSSSLGSTGHVIITTLAATVDKYTDLKNSAKSTAGGSQNMALMAENQLDFGQAPSTIWKAALEGEPPYTKKVRAVQMFAYTTFPMNPVVRADSSIKAWPDLKGKRVMAGAAGGATAVDYQMLGDVGGMDWKFNYGSWAETHNALKQGAVEAIPSLTNSGRPSPSLAELEAGMKLRVIAIPDDVIAKLRSRNPGVLVHTVTSKEWPTVEQPMRMITQGGILAAHPDVSEDVAYKVTKAIFDNEAEVRSKGVQLEDVSLKFATSQLIPEYPLHPGAARYFREKGVLPASQKVGL
jgi:TRAP transporter TAXI family solute receptor